jgi:hypothetical protein
MSEMMIEKGKSFKRYWSEMIMKNYKNKNKTEMIMKK